MSRAIAAARPSTESAVAAGQLPTRQSRKPRRPKLIDAPRQSKPCQHVDQRQLSLRSAASSHPDCRAVLIQIVAQYADIERSREGLYELALGGTAVGTGLNAPEGFSRKVAAKIAELTNKQFVTAPNKFMAQGSLDAMVRASAALRGAAVALMKIANDMRWLASGPRCGLGELKLPQNEPGSSIMPGKVNPTQCEAMVMIAIQVIGDDTAVAFAGSQGNFELNAMRPVIINNFLHAATILADGCEKFRRFSVEGTELNRERIDAYVGNSLMLVNALSPVIGYQNAAYIAEKADRMPSVAPASTSRPAMSRH